jgi:hypothetical protein
LVNGRKQTIKFHEANFLALHSQHKRESKKNLKLIAIFFLMDQSSCLSLRRALFFKRPSENKETEIYGA